MSQEIDCPACDSSILLDGDEKVGDQVFCGYCGAPYTVKEPKDDGELCVEDDY